MRAYNQDLIDRVISNKAISMMYQMSCQTIGAWVKRYKATSDYGFRQHLSRGKK